MHRDFGPGGLSILAVNIEESSSTVAGWVREKKITMPILLDPDGEVTRQYTVIATPTVVLIDRQGRVLGRIVGPRDWASSVGQALITSMVATAPGG